MKRKRISAVMTAAACAAVMLSSMPVSFAQASQFVQNDFETTYGGWYSESADDAAVITAIDGIGFNGSRGMQITGRTDSQDGPVSEKDLFLVGGQRFEYSVRVKADSDQRFTFSVQTTDPETGGVTVKVLDKQYVKAGQWATLSGSYKAPANAQSFKLKITTDSTADFIFDDVIVTGKGALVAHADHGTGIKDWLVNYGIRSGNIFNGNTINNTDIKNILLKDCNAIECENETKPDATLVQSGSTDTNIRVKADSFAKIADFCSEYNLAFRGHTLVWHNQTPEWFFKSNMGANSGSYVSESTMNQRLESYIKNMFNLYATQYPKLNLYAYDVCNECMNDQNGGPRQAGYNDGKSPWVAVYGDNHFIDKAFEYARKYAPANCHLFYNDYNEYAGFKRDAILTTAKRIKAAGNLDGVGMQSHINANANDSWSGENAYLTALKMYLEAGLEVQITELDISTDGGTFSLDQQANRYKNILKAAVDWNADKSHENRVTLFQVWGPNDGNSWVGTNKQGQSNAPLLYDKNNKPKAAYSALQSVVPQSEWGNGSEFPDSFEVKPPEVDENGYWFHYTFESGDEGFKSRGGETVAQSGEEAYIGSKSLKVSDRTAAWNGCVHNLSSSIFKPGEEYSFSVAAKYTDGSSTDKFHFTMSYTDSEDVVQYVKIDSQDAVKGEWVQLSNTNFKIPADATGVQIYVETDSSEVDFYIDEMIGAPAGTVIQGPGPAPKKLLGDVDCDGTLTAKDLSAMKAAIKSGTFASNIAKINADVDQSRKVDADDASYLMQYLVGRIDEFPVAEIPLDVEGARAAFKDVKFGTSLKKDSENNPCTTQRFGADPGWLVYGDRLYLYTTNDAFEYYSDGRLQINTYNSGTINCISTSDLVNWTDHGAIPAADKNGRTQNGAAKWAYNAWAPDAIHKKIDGKDKFFLYFANNGSGVGVLTADSPTGPFKDPLGTELVSKSNTPNMNDVVWMFDPGVYYDEDTDEGYLFMGGGVDNRDKSNPKTGRCMKLNSDMISVDKSTVTTLENPYLFEDSSLIKINNLWYYSYCANWNVPGGTNINGVSFGNADILYMCSSNPLGPWTSQQLKGMVFANTGSQRIDNGGNNHHSIIKFKDKYYVAYHSRQQALRMGLTFIDKNHPNDRSKDSNDGNYRSTQINEATFNPATGQISCKGDMTGCSQLEALDPYVTVQAETMANQSGIQISGVGDTVVTDIDAGDWVQLKGVDFGSGATSLTVRASSKNGAFIKVTAGGPNGDEITYVEIPEGGNMSDITVPVLGNASGKTNVTFSFSGQLEFDSWQFHK
ncbi:MAG TPA: glycoside hydrolase [Ruminococcus sp.]|nr:glycoside hydrolase [Ruminococcus sp.]